MRSIIDLTFSLSNFLLMANGTEFYANFDRFTTYSLPFLIGSTLYVFGMIGNLCTIFVSLRKPVSSKSVRFLFIMLAFSDLLVLNSGFLFTWIEGVVEPRIFGIIPNCEVVFFLIHVFINLSAWILVILSMQRVLVVVYPLKASTVSSLKYTIFVFFIILFLTVGFHFRISLGTMSLMRFIKR